MNLKVFFIVCCIRVVFSSYITFKPKQYEIQFDHTELQQKWSLSSYAKIAENVIKFARESIPYDLLKDIIKIYVDKTDESSSSNIKLQVIGFELPYLIMAAFPLLLVLILPICGILFCVKMCRDDDKNRMTEFEVIQKKTVKRFISASLVFTAATLILIAGIASFLASERLTSGVRLTKEMSSKSIDDLVTLTERTTSLLRILLGDDFDGAIAESTKSLNSLVDSNHLSQHVINIMKENIRVDIHHNVIHLWDLTEEAVLMLDPLIQSRQNLLLESERESKTVEDIQKDMNALFHQCESLFNTIFCQPIKLIPINDIHFGVNFTVELVDFSDSERRMQLFLLYDFNQTMAKTYESINNTGNIFFGDKEKILEATKEMTIGLQELKIMFLNKINKTSEKIAGTLETYRTKVSRWNDPTKTAEMYFSLISKLPCFLIFFLCALLYGGVFTGQFGVAHTYIWEIDEFSPPMKLARAGKDLITSFLHFFFSICVVLLILLSVLLLAGANMTHLCNSLKDGTLFEKVLDDNQTWNGYPLGRIIHNDENIPLKLSNVLSECSQGKAMWNVFKIDKLINTTGITDIRSKFPDIQDVIEIGSINTTNFIPNFAINFTDHNLGIFRFNSSSDIKLTNHTSVENIKTLIQFLRTFYIQTSYFNMDLSESAYGIYLKASILDTIIRQNIMRSYKIYDEYEELLRNQMALMSKQIELVVHRREFWKNHYENDFQDFLQQTLNFHMNDVMHVLVQYDRYVWKELRSKIGKCKILPEIYEHFKTVFCFYATDSVNALWLSFGTVVFSVVFFFPVYLELIAHYSIVGLDFNGEEETLNFTNETNVKLNLRTAREISNGDDTQWM